MQFLDPVYQVQQRKLHIAEKLYCTRRLQLQDKLIELGQSFNQLEDYMYSYGIGLHWSGTDLS